MAVDILLQLNQNRRLKQCFIAIDSDSEDVQQKQKQQQCIWLEEKFRQLFPHTSTLESSLHSSLHRQPNPVKSDSFSYIGFIYVNGVGDDSVVFLWVLRAHEATRMPHLYTGTHARHVQLLIRNPREDVHLKKYQFRCTDSLPQNHIVRVTVTQCNAVIVTGLCCES